MCLSGLKIALLLVVLAIQLGVAEDKEGRVDCAVYKRNDQVVRLTDRARDGGIVN